MAERTNGHALTRGKYPWSSWTDGSQWKIVRGEDYTLTTFSMQISLHGRARTEGKLVTSKSFHEVSTDSYGYVDHKEGLIFQFRKPAVS